MKFSYKAGDKAVIIREICGHQFSMGTVVTLVKQSSHQEHFVARDGKEDWYISIEEIIPYGIIKKKILEEIKNERA